MAQILQITDRTLTVHNKAFMKAAIDIDPTRPQAKISLYFWASFHAYKNGGNLLLGNQPIVFHIPKTCKLFRDNFSTAAILPLGKTQLINLYDSILKKIDGAEESITFYTGNTLFSTEEVEIDGEMVEQTTETEEVDIVLHSLLGLNFKNAIDSFSQKEFDLKINGLENPFDAKIIFIEDTEEYKVYSTAESEWFSIDN